MTLPAQEGRRAGERFTWAGSGRSQQPKRNAARLPWPGAVPSHDASDPGQRCPQAGRYGPRCYSAPQSPPGPGPTPSPPPRTGSSLRRGGERSGAVPHCGAGAHFLEPSGCPGRGAAGSRPSLPGPQREVAAVVRHCELVSRTKNRYPCLHPRHGGGNLWPSAARPVSLRPAAWPEPPAAQQLSPKQLSGAPAGKTSTKYSAFL